MNQGVLSRMFLIWVRQARLGWARCHDFQLKHRGKRDMKREFPKIDARNRGRETAMRVMHRYAHGQGGCVVGRAAGEGL